MNRYSTIAADVQRSSLARISRVLLPLVAILFMPFAGWAEKPSGHAGGDKAKEGEHEQPRIKATLKQEGGKPKDQVFEMKETKDREALAEAIKGGSVEELEVIAKPGMLPKYELGIWSVVVFLLLLGILYKFAWPPLLENLHKREEGIRKAIEDAHAAREEAAKLRVDLQKELDRAEEKVRDILEAGRKDAQHTKDEILAEARAEAQAEWERKRREIDTAFSQALQQLTNQSVDLAALIAEKAVRRHLTIDDQRRLIDESLTELKTAGKQRFNGHS